MNSKSEVPGLTLEAMIRGGWHLILCANVFNFLIYSSNVYLSCAGGVGACLMERYGMRFQDDLRTLFLECGIEFADRGSVFQDVTEGLPCRWVFHTVPCDVFYETSDDDVVAGVLRVCLGMCVDAGDVCSIALWALGTGLGHLQFEDFFRIASGVFGEQEFAGLELATI